MQRLVPITDEALTPVVGPKADAYLSIEDDYVSPPEALP